MVLPGMLSLKPKFFVLQMRLFLNLNLCCKANLLWTESHSEIQLEIGRKAPFINQLEHTEHIF